MRIDDIDAVITWDLNELWKAAQQINEEQHNKLKPLLDQIEQGYLLKVPIYYIIEEWYDLYAQGQSVNIHGYGKHSIHKFMKDIEKRETTLRNIIYENQEDNDPTEAR